MFKAIETSSTLAHQGLAIQPAGVLPAHNSLTVVETLQALRDMERQWRELEDHVQNNITVFQSFDWVMAWAETYLDKNSTPSLLLLTGRDKGELVFIWPLMRTRQMGLSTLTWLTEPFGQYGDVLCRVGHNPKQWLHSSIAFLGGLNNVDLLRLRHVRADSHLALHGQNLLIDAKLPEKAPFLDLTAFKSDDDYDQRYTSVQRKRRKKIRKALEIRGALSFKRLPVGSPSDSAMQQAVVEKNAWLSERGRMNRVLGDPLHVPFLKNLSRRLNGTTEVIVTELTAGENPVSWEIGFRHRGIHYGYITSHVNALTDLSPGRLHMDLAQRACLADGMTRFDLMVPNDSHKESWSSGTVDTSDYYLPLSASGRFMGLVYLKTLRPLMRKLYYKATAKKLTLKTIFKSTSKPSTDA